MSSIDQAAVSRYFIEAGIAKHRTRIDVLFLKAVRSLPALVPVPN